VSLVSMLVCGLALLVVSGPAMFWVFGLLLTVFVGPAQASARSFLIRLAPPGRAGQMFGLYTTTRRAASCRAPTPFGLSVWLVVLGAGLLVLLPVRGPETLPGERVVERAH